MNKKLFGSLIKKPEGRILDFKISGYNFKIKEDEDAKFIKDVLSFSNTVRNEPSFIIAGISESRGGCELVGIESFPDDAILQQKAMDKIWPKPVFSSYQFRYENKIFGIIEFPVHSYDRPLVATKPLKGVVIDTVYLRRGSSNSEANATEIINLVDWLASFKLNTSQKNSLNDNAEEILAALSDTNIPLSASLSKLLIYAKKAGKSKIAEFATNELTTYNGKKKKYPQTYKFRVIKVPSSPYEITIPNQRWSASQIIDHMYTQKEFWEIDFFFHYPILELEEMIANSSEKESLLILKIPYKLLFPEVESNIPKATIFFSPRMLKTLYTSIRNYAIKLLVDNSEV